MSIKVIVPWLPLEYNSDRQKDSKSATNECSNGLLCHIGDILHIWILLFLGYVCTCVCVCTARLTAMRTRCFSGDRHRLRRAPCLRSWPGNPQKQDATCCLSRERPSLLLRTGTYSSQQKVGRTHTQNHTVHPDYTTATHTADHTVFRPR